MDNHGDDIYESYDFSYFNNMQENELQKLLAEMKNDPVAQSEAGATLSQYDEPVLANHQTSTPFAQLQIDPQLLAIDRQSLGTNISNRRTSTPTAQPPIDPRVLDAKNSNQSTPIPISQAKIGPKLQNVFKLGAAASISQEELEILASDIAEGTIPDFTTFSNDLISNPTVQFESSAAGIPDLRPAPNNPNYKPKDFSALASIPSIRFAQSVSGNSKQSTAPTPETRGHAIPLVANTGILDQNTTPATNFRGVAGRGISKHNTRSQTGLPRSGTSNKKKSVSSNIADNNNFHQSLAPSRGLAGSGTLSQGRAPPSGRASSATSDQSVATLDSRGLAQNDANTAELARLKAELQEYKAKIARLEQEATKSQVSWKVDGPVNRSYPAQTRPTTSIRGQSTQLGAPPLPVSGVSKQNSPQSQLDPTTTRVNGPDYEEFVNFATSVNEPRATSDSAPAADEAPKLWSKAAEAIARDRFEHDSNYSYEDWNQKDDIYNRSREDMMTTVVCSPDCGCPDKANHKYPNLGNTKFVM